MHRRLFLASGFAIVLAIALTVSFIFVIDGNRGEEAIALTEDSTTTPEKEPSESGESFNSQCTQSIQREYSCYEEHLVHILNTQGASAALVALAEMAASDSFARAECHPLTHSIGRAALIEYKTFQIAVQFEDGTCWSGFTHGILESFMFRYSIEELPKAINSVCIQDPDHAYSFDYYNCVHGLGHGVSWRFDNGVFEALPICDTLEGRWEQQSCHSGVFMQNIVVDGKSHQSRELRPDEPMYPCTAVDEKYKKTCYLMQTSYALRTVDYDYAQGFELCETEADQGYVDVCYRSMGRDISGNSHRESGKVVSLCSLGDPDLQTHCFQGAVKNAVFNDHGLDNANELCDIVPARYREDCIAARDQAASTL